MNKQWLLKPNADQDKVHQLQSELNIDRITAQLLVQRGVNDFEESKIFFRPSLDDLHNPFLMKDMAVAIERIEKAMLDHEHILIYGDYDVDGTTAVSLLYTYFSTEVGYDRLSFYIPDRYKEGYGLSLVAIDWASQNHYSLIITLDCGITAHEATDYANQKGIDIIISDHHLPTDTLPKAFAILNPKQKDCGYPFEELSGCGIGFKIAQAFAKNNRLDLKPLYDMLDLLAVSIASDVVPIVGENRILAHFGLKKLSENPSMGLKAIKNLCLGTKSDVTISDIVFKIGPRINAAGRMGDARRVVRLLIANETLDAETKADLINEVNTERKDVDATITKKALEAVEKIPNFGNRRSTVVYGNEWHKGVIGIVASRLIEHYYKPTIVFTESEGLFTGSARSVDGFDIYAAIFECREYLERFGGHKYAAGLSIKREHLKAFIEKFESVVCRDITQEQLTPKIDIDLKIKFKDISPKFFRLLKQFAPFGPWNMQPIFRADQVFVPQSAVKIVGENHLQMAVQQEGSEVFSVIAFGQGGMYDKLLKGIPFDMVFTVEESSYKGKSYTKLFVKDIRF